MLRCLARLGRSVAPGRQYVRSLSVQPDVPGPRSVVTISTWRFQTIPDAEAYASALEGPDAGIVCITLDRPAARNAMGRRLIAELNDALDAVAGNRSVRVVLIRSACEGMFCAGADLKERANMTPGAPTRPQRDLRRGCAVRRRSVGLCESAARDHVQAGGPSAGAVAPRRHASETVTRACAADDCRH